MTGRSEVARRISLDEVRYSTVWEDAEMLRAALQICPDDDVLSIMSAGDNVLALLLDEPKSITAIDMSPAQVALFELKLAGIRELDHASFLALLGYGLREDRLATYHRLQTLDDATRQFWDARATAVEAGIARCGRLERYFEAFAQEQLVDLWPTGLTERLLTASTLEAQVALFDAEAFTPAFQEAFRAYFGRESMAARGREPAQFAYVEDGDVGGYFLGRFRNVCRTLPLKGNFYVERFLTGRQRNFEVGPHYLRPAEFERLTKLIDRVSIVRAELEAHLDAVPDGAYSKVQLSDVFEYMSEPAADLLFEQLSKAMRRGGRLAYWNLLVPRTPPQHLRDRFNALTELADGLWQGDRAWFYRAFCVEEVVT